MVVHLNAMSANSIIALDTESTIYDCKDSKTSVLQKAMKNRAFVISLNQVKIDSRLILIFLNSKITKLIFGSVSEYNSIMNSQQLNTENYKKWVIQLIFHLKTLMELEMVIKLGRRCV